MKEIDQYSKELICDKFLTFLIEQVKYVIEGNDDVSRREAKKLIWKALKEFMGESLNENPVS